MAGSTGRRGRPRKIPLQPVSLHNGVKTEILLFKLQVRKNKKGSGIYKSERFCELLTKYLQKQFPAVTTKQVEQWIVNYPWITNPKGKPPGLRTQNETIKKNFTVDAREKEAEKDGKGRRAQVESVQDDALVMAVVPAPLPIPPPIPPPVVVDNSVAVLVGNQGQGEKERQEETGGRIIKRVSEPVGGEPPAAKKRRCKGVRSCIMAAFKVPVGKNGSTMPIISARALAITDRNNGSMEGNVPPENSPNVPESASIPPDTGQENVEPARLFATQSGEDVHHFFNSILQTKDYLRTSEEERFLGVNLRVRIQQNNDGTSQNRGDRASAQLGMELVPLDYNGWTPSANHTFIPRHSNVDNSSGAGENFGGDGPAAQGGVVPAAPTVQASVGVGRRRNRSTQTMKGKRKNETRQEKLEKAGACKKNLLKIWSDFMKNHESMSKEWKDSVTFKNVFKYYSKKIEKLCMLEDDGPECVDLAAGEDIPPPPPVVKVEKTPPNVERDEAEGEEGEK